MRSSQFGVNDTRVYACEIPYLTLMGSIWEQGAEENIWTQDG
jgi:hypothetical protein